RIDSQMGVNRRELLQWLGSSFSALALSRFAKAQSATSSTTFLATRASLEGYRIGSATQSLVYGRTGARNLPSKTETGTHEICISRDLRNTTIMSRLTGT